MRTKPAIAGSKPIGARIDVELWKQMRILALEQDRPATTLLNEAMKEFIVRHKGKSGKTQGAF